jgi:hypothetical protein
MCVRAGVQGARCWQCDLNCDPTAAANQQLDAVCGPAAAAGADVTQLTGNQWLKLLLLLLLFLVVVATKQHEEYSAVFCHCC